MMPDEATPERPPVQVFTFQIVIEKEAAGEGYTAYSPTLAGCFRRAGTIDEAKERIRAAVRERVDALLTTGERISQCERLLHVEELSIAVPNRPTTTRRKR